MDLNTQTRLLDRLSYVHGHLAGAAATLKMLDKKENSKKKLIQLLEILAYNIEQSIETVRTDPGCE